MKNYVDGCKCMCGPLARHKLQMLHEYSTYRKRIHASDRAPPSKCSKNSPAHYKDSRYFIHCRKINRSIVIRATNFALSVRKKIIL